MKAGRGGPRIAGVFSRRQIVVASGFAAASLIAVRRAFAEELPVPVPLQVKLLAKVASYDKNLPGRAGDRVRVHVVTKSGDSDAKRVLQQALAALGEEEKIAGLPIEASSSSFVDSAALKKAIVDGHLSIVYLTSGFDATEIGRVAGDLAGVDVLSAAAIPTTVPRGIVLGFDLVSGKPKILVNLTQAKKQKVALAADLLKLAKVYE